jgi:hypothetical protein
MKDPTFVPISLYGVKNDGKRALRRILSRRWALIAAVFCLTASLVVASCGTDESEQSVRTATTTESAPGATHPNLVTDAEIERYPEGSPQRAVLDWFQAVQFRDEAGVRQSTTDREVERVSRKTLDDAVALIGPALGKPRVVSTRTRGTRAAIRLFIQSFVPGKREPVGETPSTFYLTRTGDGWRVDDVRYLVAAWAEIRAQKPESG